MKIILVVLNAIALLSCASMSRADELLKMKPGMATMVRIPGAEKGDMKAIVGDPKIADVAFGPNNVFWFIGKKPGTTNIIVLDRAVTAATSPRSHAVLPRLVTLKSKWLGLSAKAWKRRTLSEAPFRPTDSDIMLAYGCLRPSGNAHRTAGMVR